MSFAVFTNLIVILLCAAVLVQSVRMMRSFRAVKDGGLQAVVAALDASTAQARAVLSDLKETLRTEAADNARIVAEGRAIREELSVMVGIANAVAERIVETVEANKLPKAKAGAAERNAEAPAKRPRAPRKPATKAEAVA